MEVLAFENHEFEGRNNAYLFSADGDVTLIDTGIATPDQFEDELAAHGLSVEDIDQILLTHWHPDHSGLAGDIQARSGATVYVHEKDAPLVRQEDALRERQQTLFDEWGMPPAARETLQPHLAVDEVAGRPPTIETFADGKYIDAGASKFEVLAVPGHTVGLSCFVFQGETGQEALVGDAILPEYTPNVGGADVRVDRPLERYLDTLETIIDEDFERVWPGHRGVIESPTERARTIIEHHRNRARKVLAILSEAGPADAWTVSAHLFGDLEGIHILHGPGEAYAHLDHLERHGLVERTRTGYVGGDESTAVDSII